MRSILLLTLILFVHIGSAEGDTTVIATDANNSRTQTGYGTTRKASVSDIRIRNGATFNDVTPINKYLFFYSAGSEGHKKSATSNWEDSNYLPVAFVCDLGVPGGIDTSGKTIEMTKISKQYLADHSEADLNTDGVINITDSELFSNWWLDNCTLNADLNLDGFVDILDYTDFISGNFDPVPAAEGDFLPLQIIDNNDVTTKAGISPDSQKGDIVFEDASSGAINPPKQAAATAP